MEGDCFLLLTGFRRLVISIHSLRMEGDGGRLIQLATQLKIISIHSLRMEGDRWLEAKITAVPLDFNPLPPHGGRQQNCTGKRFSFRLSLYNPAKKDAKDYILHPKKWFFSKKGRKIWCETFSIFLCAYDSHRHFSLKFLSQNQRLFHVYGFLCTDMFHLRLITISQVIKPQAVPFCINRLFQPMLEYLAFCRINMTLKDRILHPNAHVGTDLRHVAQALSALFGLCIYIIRYNYQHTLSLPQKRRIFLQIAPQIPRQQQRLHVWHKAPRKLFL